MAASPPTPPMTSAERAARARQVAQLRAGGATWKAVAQRVGVSTRQAQRLEEEHLRAGAAGIDPGEPHRALAEALEVFAWGMEKLAALAEEADNSSAAVAAISRRCDLAERRLGLLAAAGLVPHDRGGWRVAIDLPRILRAIIDVAQRHGAEFAEVDAELRRIPGMVPLPTNGGGP